ncbi:sugar (pentulose and hexulose) kinase [Actinobacillus equuli]|nr:sugar (pentulose and hexulose) kinase [Actinobacillus equuli]
MIKPNQIAGYVTEAAAKLTGLAVGTPVVGGLFDVVSTARCANLDDESKLNAVLGTWSVVSGITDNLDPTQTLPLSMVVIRTKVNLSYTKPARLLPVIWNGL